MTSKKGLRSLVAACTVAGLMLATCGCEDLGAYEDVNEYYSSFGNVTLIKGDKSDSDYSISDYFYNEGSREDFLEDKDGAYSGVPISDYVYMAIPVETGMQMDTLALYMYSDLTQTIQMSMFIVDKLPENPKCLDDIVLDENGDPVLDENGNLVGKTEQETDDEGNPIEEVVFDDPDPATRIADFGIRLNGGKWDSFLVDKFSVGGKSNSSVWVDEGQYILIQFRNNSGIRIYDGDTQSIIDEIIGVPLERAEFTMTNLLVRALELKAETQG